MLRECALVTFCGFTGSLLCTYGQTYISMSFKVHDMWLFHGAHGEHRTSPAHGVPQYCGGVICTENNRRFDAVLRVGGSRVHSASCLSLFCN